ncbi:MAG: hypothetical protein IJM20_07375 [Clostridia bacterium]|nr:hypothetical protein [Clostridia bacterium]
MYPKFLYAHGQCLFAAGAAAGEASVEVESGARKEAEILEKREQREEDRHRREHDRNDEGDGAENAEDKRVTDEGENAEADEKAVKKVFETAENIGEQAGRVIRADDREIKYAEQQKEHQRERREAARHDPIDPLRWILSAGRKLTYGAVKQARALTKAAFA